MEGNEPMTEKLVKTVQEKIINVYESIRPLLTGVSIIDLEQIRDDTAELYKSNNVPWSQRTAAVMVNAAAILEIESRK